jgi:hypothetical protein
MPPGMGADLSGRGHLPLPLRVDMPVGEQGVEVKADKGLSPSIHLHLFDVRNEAHRGLEASQIVKMAGHQGMAIGLPVSLGHTLVG